MVNFQAAAPACLHAHRVVIFTTKIAVAGNDNEDIETCGSFMTVIVCLK